MIFIIPLGFNMIICWYDYLCLNEYKVIFLENKERNHAPNVAKINISPAVRVITKSPKIKV